jgi:hypothetical protein
MNYWRHLGLCRETQCHVTFESLCTLCNWFHDILALPANDRNIHTLQCRVLGPVLVLQKLKADYATESVVSKHDSGLGDMRPFGVNAQTSIATFVGRSRLFNMREN